MKNIYKKTPFMREVPGLFSPLHIMADILEGGKAPALYKFTTAFLPSLGPGILNILLDMEKHSRKVIAFMKPEERESLIKELEGITVEMRYVVKDKGQAMLELPISISPAEVLKNAALNKAGSRYNNEMQEEINKIFVSFIEKEIQRRMKAAIENFFKTLLARPRIPAMLKELLSRGWIDKEGRLAEGTTIQDLISGKYARVFKDVVPQELINEALIIKETMKACYEGEDEDDGSVVNETLREKGILEITLGEVAQAG